MEGVIGCVHEDAAAEIDDGIGHAGLRGSLEDAIAGKAGLEVGRAQDAAGAILAIGRHGVQIVDQLALVPDVIAGGEHVRAQVEEVFGDLRGDAEAAGGVLSIDDDEFDVVGLTDMPDVLADDLSSRAAEDIADEENVQGVSSSWVNQAREQGTEKHVILLLAKPS